MPALIFRKLRDDAAPAADELWLRPARAEDRLRRAVGRLVFERGLEVLERGAGPIARIVVNAAGTQPTFDEMLAALFVQQLIDNQVLSPPFAHLAKYAELLRQGKVPTKLPPDETIEGVFLAIRNRAGGDLTDPAVAARFLEGWQNLAARIACAAAENVDVFQTSLFTGGAFADEKAYLLEDFRRYRRDVLRGEKWTVRLPGAEKRESALFLREPRSSQFPYWSRRDSDTPTGDPYLFLVVCWGKGSWDFSTDPAHATSALRDLAGLLQKEEAASPTAFVGAAWYDGGAHHHTIVSSPRPDGTRLADKRVLAVAKKWAKAKRASPRRPWLRAAVRSIEATALVTVCALAVYLLLLAIRPNWDQAIYPRVAPAVVMVKTQERGTGFFVASDGWLVTNHHVIRTARPDLRTGAMHATIYRGKLIDGQMQLVDEGLPALLYKDDPRRDLALLKLSGAPAAVPFLTVAPAALSHAIRPGLDCLAIGNAWTHNRGDVRRVYNYPREDPNVTDLVRTAEDQENLKRALAKMERKIILSSCGLSPGDSGGPLVNNAGEAIGVSFALPTNKDGGILGKLTLHVHLDELIAFLADRPAQPSPYLPALPYDWPKESDYAPGIVLAGKQDEMIFKNSGATTGLWIDVSGKNAPIDDPADLGVPGKDPVKTGAWHYQFALRPGDALHPGTFPTAYYDTANRGFIDLIVQAPSVGAKPDCQWRLQDKTWTIEAPAVNRPLLSADWFTAEDLRRDFAPYVRALTNRGG